jgi:hypothetical protein
MSDYQDCTVLRFPLPILISPNAPLLSIAVWGWYNGTFTAQAPKGSVSHLPKEENITLT